MAGEFEVLCCLVLPALAIAFIIFASIGGWWTKQYNTLQTYYNNAQRAFADIDVVMQQRMDLLPAVAQAIKKYDVHEYNSLKDVIATRGKLDKSSSLNERVASAQDLQNSYLKIQAVFERYPQLKSSSLYDKVVSGGDIANIEQSLKEGRLVYNKAVEQYNLFISTYPNFIVAAVHGYKKLEYLSLGNRPNQASSGKYEPKKLFKD